MDNLTSASHDRVGTLYTFGYGKVKNGPDLATLIGDEKIDVVLDVRFMPTGRNPLWRPGLVADTVHKGGIEEYIHARSLGNPDYRNGQPATRVVDREEGMAVVTGLLSMGKNVALMCVCKDNAHCHRRLPVAWAREMIPGLQVVELEVGKDPVRS